MYCYRSAAASVFKTPSTPKPINEPQPQITEPQRPEKRKQQDDGGSGEAKKQHVEKEPEHPTSVDRPPTGSADSEQEPPTDPVPGPSKEPVPGPSGESRRPKAGTSKSKQWYEDGEDDVDEDGKPIKWIRADKVPGQSRITTTMTQKQKTDTAYNNEVTRLMTIEAIEKKIPLPYHIRLRGKNLNLGITTEGHYGGSDAEQKALEEYGKPKTKPPAPTEAPKPATPAPVPATPAPVQEWTQEWAAETNTYRLDWDKDRYVVKPGHREGLFEQRIPGQLEIFYRGHWYAYQCYKDHSPPSKRYTIHVKYYPGQCPELYERSGSGALTIAHRYRKGHRSIETEEELLNQLRRFFCEEDALKIYTTTIDREIKQIY